MPSFIRKKFKTEKSLGEILKQARKKKEITLDQTEEETKVRVKYLRALEEGRYDNLPNDVYAIGFLGKYVDFLGLNKESLVLRYKTERGKEKENYKLMPTRRMREPWLFFTSKTLIILMVVLIVLGIIGYIVYSVRSLTSAPNLQISSPSQEQVLKEDKVDIIGKTDAGVTLLINNQTILLDGNGNFNQQVKLNPGLNTFEIKAINQLKKETVKQIKILGQF